MAKKFLDQVGLSHLWSMILEELNKKASKVNLASVENRVEVLENAEYEFYGGSATDVMQKEGE